MNVRVLLLTMGAVLVLACTEKRGPTNTPGQSAMASQTFAVDSDFEFDGATKVELPKIPEIQNKIGDAGDDDLRDRVIENKIIETFDGMLIQMTADLNPGEKVKISASGNGRSFETESDVSSIESQDGALLGYVARTKFENKFWLGSEDWTIQVSSAGNDIFTGNHKFALITELLSSNFSDSPFVKTDERNLKKDTRYIYRFKNSGDDVVVLYRSEDWETFVPVLMLKPDQGNFDSEIGVKWKNESSKGVYYVTHYSKNRLPEKSLLTMLFDSREVE